VLDPRRPIREADIGRIAENAVPGNF